MTELEFALNTFYLLMSGALVMWMAAGFTMLEAGLVRSKNAAEIVMAAELIDNYLLDKRFMRELEDDKEYDAA